jgi:hypothetical protein
MSSLRKALKSAREAIVAKEYREALQHCKQALKEDPSCYEAYVYVTEQQADSSGLCARPCTVA